METPSTLTVCPWGAYSTASWGHEPLGQHCIWICQNVMQKVQYMEERVNFVLLGEEVSRPLAQIYQLRPLLQPKHIKQIRLPVEMRSFIVNLEVLHSCLYYIIGIQKNLTGEGSGELRQKCLQDISNYYIRRKMSFQIYEYGYLCSRILSLSMEKVVHLIYYMVYARLASKPYIANLISQRHNKARSNRNHTLKSENESVHSRSIDSRHFTVFMENHQMQVDIFRKDLKKVLCNEHNQLKKTKKTENKRYFNIRKVYPDEQNSFSLPDEDSLPAYNKRVITIPFKVGPHDNSSIITRLKFSPTMTEAQEHRPYKRLQLRRQKFNEDFDCNKKYETMGKLEKKDVSGVVCSTNKLIEESTKNNNAYRLQKHPYQYFRSMASTIKSRNKELDHIRSECTTHSLKKTVRGNQWKRQKKDEIRLKTAEGSYLHQSTLFSNSPAFKNFQELSSEPNRVLQSQKENRNEVDRKISQQSLGGEGSGGGEGSASLVTRKAAQLGAEERLLLFSKKMKNKFKVQKYKQQYRQFLKTQMFERVRNIL